jgi:tRNA pseudouridine38-40 synthase
MRRIKFNLAYDGTDFHGWQLQPGLITIQGTLEQAFAEIEGKPVHVAGSGRTDAGVHALCQTAAVSLSNPIPLANLRKAANRLLPPSIRILDVAEAARDFHPRYHATSKTYEYRIFRGEVCPPVEWRYVHHYPYPLDLDRMTELAPILDGSHDCGAFAAADDRELESTVRTIFSSRIETTGDYLFYRVSGSGFLKHMVRNIVGTLLEAGKGNLDAEGFRALLTPGAGKRAGPTVPAKGLFLVRVVYGRCESGVAGDDFARG